MKRAAGSRPKGSRCNLARLSCALVTLGLASPARLHAQGVAPAPGQPVYQPAPPQGQPYYPAPQGQPYQPAPPQGQQYYPAPQGQPYQPAPPQGQQYYPAPQGQPYQPVPPAPAQQAQQAPQAQPGQPGQPGAPQAQWIAQPAPPPPDATPAPATPPAATSPAPELAWDLLHRRFSSWNGPSGGLFLLDGRAGEPGAVRVQLGLDAFAGSNYLTNNDHVEVSNQTLSISATANEYFEFFASLANRSTNQSRPKPSVSLDALGDVTLGGKFGTALTPVVDLGADLRFVFANKSGGGGFEWGATNVWLRSALSFDLQKLEKPAPFIMRFNIGYLFDNTAALVSKIEDQRFASLGATGGNKADETTHLVSRFERLAMGVNRFDRFTFGAGFEVPLQVAEHFYIHPLAEWQLGVPVNRQGYDCPFVAGNMSSGSKSTAEDGCFERSPGVVPMNLALGVRVAPPVRGLSFLAGVDIGLTGTTKFVRELAPNVPWRILFGLSFDYDARPTAPSTGTTQVAGPMLATAPMQTAHGRVQGIVTAADGTPVADAHVRFLDRELTALATGTDGKFTTEALAPGAVSFEATHPDYEFGRCITVIQDVGGDAEVHCTLTPKPLVGKLEGQVLDSWGGPIAGARVIITGPTNSLLISDARGAFDADNLAPGAYTLRVEAGGYFTRQSKSQIEARSTTLMSPALTRKPITPAILVRGDAIDAPTLRFQGESNELDGSSLEVIAELTDFLLSRSDLYLQIQGYGPDAVAMARALGIKQRLVEAGVPETHIEAVSGGTNKMRLSLHR